MLGRRKTYVPTAIPTMILSFYIQPVAIHCTD